MDRQTDGQTDAGAYDNPIGKVWPRGKKRKKRTKTV